MIKLEGAVIKEQGITFAIVAVQSHVFNSSHTLNEAADTFSFYFPGMPIILVRSTSKGPEYYGRTDIVKFLSNIHPSRIPWKEYTFD